MVLCQGCTRCVLVVEDDEDVRDAIATALFDEGYEVQTAGHGQEALELLRGRGPDDQPCLILLDLMMPVMNGWQLVEALRAEDAYAAIPVVVVSAMAEGVPGAVASMKKPIQLAALLDLVRQHCLVHPQPACGQRSAGDSRSGA